jgi:cardiolipin synthase (CMP-forming)
MISNAITIFRTLLTIPLFALLAFGGGAYGSWPLLLFLGAGLLDMVDGKVARARNETSAFGAMIDLVGDRLLTFAAVLGLIVGGTLTGIYIVAGIVLIVRDLVVASLNEALPGKLEIKVSLLEKFKIVAAFTGLAALIASQPLMHAAATQGAAAPDAPDGGWGMAMIGTSAQSIGSIALLVAAVLTAITLVDYWRRALREFAKG